MMKQLTAVLVLAVGAGCGEGAAGNVDSIVAYSRENNSGTYAYFKEHVLDNEDFAAEIQTLPGTAAVINAVSKDRGSIGYGGIGYVKGVRALKIKKDAATASVEPTLDNVVKGTYPISRSLFFYTAGAPEGAARHFIAWAVGTQGQKICSEVGYYPLKQPGPDAGPAPAGKATITMKGSDTMVILGQRWAEHYMKSNPEITIQITGGGSGTGIAALINGATNICMSSRPMKQAEKDKIRDKFGKDPVEFSVALDSLAVFVHESSRLHEISIPELKSIYTGRTRLWSALGKP